MSEAIDRSNEMLVVSPYILAELDYLVFSRHGSAAEHAVLAQLTSVAWELAEMSLARLESARAIVERYSDQPIGLADASNVVLADAYQTRSKATLDRRRFSLLRVADGRPPVITPDEG
ncbi:PIN domain-containing protein [Agromyces silvae]|uniref:VapC toxin family PIN domain ribonuclease n=1 Tax=Agromyces silvae TaxID=3388266 RepID=UPI00280B5470|nr:VapC toxin family PIN domain ribonuclease [Agromyces protaetiae]